MCDFLYYSWGTQEWFNFMQKFLAAENSSAQQQQVVTNNFGTLIESTGLFSLRKTSLRPQIHTVIHTRIHSSAKVLWPSRMSHNSSNKHMILHLHYPLSYLPPRKVIMKSVWAKRAEWCVVWNNGRIIQFSASMPFTVLYQLLFGSYIPLVSLNNL